MGAKFGKSLFIFALVLCFLLLVVVRVPASWGAWAVHKAVPAVWLTGVSGTVWDGRAGGGTAMLEGQAVPVENLRWQLKPWALLRLQVCAEVQTQLLDQPASGVFCGAPGDKLEAQDVQFSLPMAVVSEWTGADLAGLASIQLQTLRLTGQRVETLRGNLSWRDARWHDGERWVSVGAFAADLQANEQGGVRAEIFDLDGPFTVSLTGDFVLNQEPVIKGEVAASEQAPAQIRDMLLFIGVPLEDGTIRIAWPPGS